MTGMYDFYDDSHIFMDGADAGFISAFFAVFAVFYLIMLAVGIVCYIFQSLGLYTIAKRRGILSPWLAWIPIGSLWIMGSISDQYQYVAKGRVKNRRKVLMGLTVAMLAFCVFMPLLAFIILAAAVGAGEAMALGTIGIVLILYLVMLVLAVLLTVFQYIALYDIYNSCNPNDSVTYLVLSIFISITTAFFLFACRNKDYGMPPRKDAVVKAIEPAPAQEAEPVSEETPVQEAEAAPEETIEE